MSDVVDNLCNDYGILKKKLAEKEAICNELLTSSENLNNALLFRLMKSQEQNNKENRDLTYTIVLLSYVLAIVALATLETNTWKLSEWPLILLWVGTLIIVVGGMIYIRNKHKKNS